MPNTAPTSPGHPAPARILFGAAYYAEYQLSDRVDQDFDLMAAAGFTVVRVGESVWSTWEPRDGEFDLDWLEPVLDAAHKRQISVILGTPTYAVPPWLQVKHPEIAAQRSTGSPVPWGARQESDFSHPTYRIYAERIIRKVIERYAGHPAVIGFQVDNEPGLVLSHNPSTFRVFVERLKQKYKTVDELNRAWGLTYWSHRIGEWSELWAPDGNAQPQYDLAWRRYQADLTTEFISWQADIVREYSRVGQFVTTCLQYPRPALDDESLAASLDIVAGNPYFDMQDRLDWSDRTPLAQLWTTTGVPGVFRQGDRMFASSQARFLVTETNVSSIAGSSNNYPPYPGQLRQSAFALVARGAAQIEYWHWHSLHFGTETYWGGILPHSQVPGRIYREVAELGSELAAIGTSLDGYEPDADVAMLWSTDSRFAFDFMPPLNDGQGHGLADSYLHIFDAFHEGIIRSGAQVRVLHTKQGLALGAVALARRYPVLVVPALYVATDDELALLTDYAAAGGHLVVGPRTGYADEEARARLAIAPPLLDEAVGAHYEEFSNVDEPLALVAGAGLRLSAEARATAWADGLIADDAEVLATYSHPELARFAAITSRASGSGRVTYVGTVPNRELAADIFRFAIEKRVADGWIVGPNVTVSSGVVADRSRVWFIHNWSGVASTITPATGLRSLTSPDAAGHPAGTEISLEPWAALALVDG